MSRIMIMGDSWACGEYSPDHQLRHAGTAQYLRDAGHEVTSIAAGGSSNWAQLDRMAPHHAMHPLLRDQDWVIWFVTDPLRDLDSLGEPQPTTRAAFDRRRDGLLLASGHQLARLWRGRVLLVGGVEPVPDWLVGLRPQWHRVVQDWVRWLIPHAQVSMAHNNRAWRYPHCDPELLAYHERREGEVAQFRWRAEHDPAGLEHRYWWPDGLHPNREAHRRLCQELILPLL